MLIGCQVDRSKARLITSCRCRTDEESAKEHEIDVSFHSTEDRKEGAHQPCEIADR